MTYGYISGKVLALEGGEATVLAEGTGLGLQVTVAGTARTTALPGRTSALWIYHHINDAGQRLFGFSTPQEKEFFLTLLKVDGVGPKTAAGLMELGKDTLLAAIAAADEKAVRQAPGVGPKLAKKIILELSGTLVADDASTAGKKLHKTRTPDDDLTDALVNMGYDKDRVRNVVESLPSDVDGVGERTTLALRALARG